MQVMLVTILLLCLGTVNCWGQHSAVYRNESLGFCVSYPKHWSVEPFNRKAGEFLPPSFAPIRPIEIGGTSNQPNDQQDGQPNTLDENLHIVVNELRTQLKKITGLRTKTSSLGSLPATEVELTYADSKTGGIYRMRQILALSGDLRTVFFATLNEPADKPPLDLAFQQIVDSFHLNCVRQE